MMSGELALRDCLRLQVSMLATVLEMDEGRYSTRSSPKILYVTRLAVRVETYLTELLEHNGRAEDYTGATRGLACKPETLVVIREAQATIKNKLLEEVLPLLSGWCRRCVERKQTVSACTLFAHMSMICSGLALEHLDQERVSIILTAQMFLHNNYRFSLDGASGGRNTLTETGIDGLGFTETEIFDAFCRQRNKILAWLTANPSECNEVMETAVRVVTLTSWFHDAGTMKARDWSPSATNAGSFQPDTEVRTEDMEEDGRFASYEDWLRVTTTQVVETEVNIQLGEFTLKKQQMQLLPEEVYDMRDFIQVFGLAEKGNGMMCAVVQHTTNRSWLRMVGCRHDVQIWEQDTRPHGAHFPNPLSRRYPDGLKPGEEWVSAQVDWWLHAFQPTVNLQMQDDSCADADAAYCRLAGRFGPATEEDGTPSKEPLRELVVIKCPPVLHVYNVVEHGRRWYRELIFTSNSEACFHEMDHLDSPTPGIHSAAGWIDKPAPLQKSVVITRNLNAIDGVQTFVPPRLLTGVMPDILLFQYELWQSEDGNVIGYHRTKDGAQLNIQLLRDPGSDPSGFCASGARAAVRRTIQGDEQAPTETLVLVDVLYAGSTPELKALREFATRVDDLSNCLVWTKPPADGASAATAGIELVEFPRLHMSFRVKTDSAGELRLFSEDHSDMFVSNCRAPAVEKVLAGLPTGILLENANTGGAEFSVLLSAGTRPEIVKGGAGANSSYKLDRSSTEWLANLGDVRHYLYPLHHSGAFLSTSTLASSLYLMLLRFLASQYSVVFAMAQTCVSDMAMSPDEAQVFGLLEGCGYDPSPDAVACRIKLYLAMIGSESTMPCPWHIADEAMTYIRLRVHVSAGCRLTSMEELAVLECCPDPQMSMEMRNRKEYLLAVQGAFAGEQLAMTVHYPPKPLGSVPFDSISDNTCLKPGIFESVIVTVGTYSYKRPIEAATEEVPEQPLAGGAAIELLDKHMRKSGFRLTDKLGFLFFYELLTGTLPLKICDTDSSHTLAKVLLRMLPAQDRGPGLLLSVLRILADNPRVCSDMPKYVKEKTGFFSKSHESTFVGQVIQFMQNNRHKLTGDWEIYDGPEHHWLMVGPPGEAHPGSAHSPETVTSQELLSMEMKDRSHICARVQDFSCGSRELRAHASACRLADGTDLRVTAASLEHFSTTPMGPIDLAKYITNEDGHDGPLSPELPFQVEQHKLAKSHVALDMLTRLSEDVRYFSGLPQQLPRIVGMCDADLDEIASQPTGGKANQALGHVAELRKVLAEQRAVDQAYLSSAIKHAEELANTRSMPSSRRCTTFQLGQQAGEEAELEFELLVAMLLDSNGDETLAKVTPCLPQAELIALQDLVVGAVLTSGRLKQTMACEGLAAKVWKLLGKFNTGLRKELEVQSSTLADMLGSERFCIHKQEAGAKLIYDPRFVVFEFAYGMILRGPQHALVVRFMEAVGAGKSLCHQMIMGAGKSTVVGPLLSLLLGDGEKLVTLVVPGPLLEFSRGVLREKFSALIHKPVYTFIVDRHTQISPLMLNKLHVARRSGAVVVSSPTSIKSFVLKLIEHLHTLDRCRPGESHHQILHPERIVFATPFENHSSPVQVRPSHPGQPLRGASARSSACARAKEETGPQLRTSVSCAGQFSMEES